MHLIVTKTNNAASQLMPIKDIPAMAKDMEAEPVARGTYRARQASKRFHVPAHDEREVSRKLNKLGGSIRQLANEYHEAWGIGLTAAKVAIRRLDHRYKI